MTIAADRARREAQEAAANGDAALAFNILDRAARAHPGDASLWNSAGNAGMRADRVIEATDRFARAAELAPDALEYGTNLAIALGRQGRDDEAIEVLRRYERTGVSDVRYCSARAARALATGDRAEAARWYDAALALDPAYARASHGRARIALERGEADALERFERAIAANPADAECWLGKAQALEAAGRQGEASGLADALVSRAPHWIDALRLRSALLLADGEKAFTRPFAEAEARAPDNPAIPIAHCETLAALDLFADAAEVAAVARRRFPSSGELAVLEAQNAGAAGDLGRAERIWRDAGLRGAPYFLYEARHRLRVRDPERAEQLLTQALVQDPWNITAWALRGLAWRMLDDPRSHWLHGQQGLVAVLPLPGADQLLGEAVPFLHALHDRSARPLGQSLRGGTQTRGGLFDRQEAPLAALHEAIVVALESYREQLPSTDDAHPLLRHRDQMWRIAGSWSVRLSGGGDHHTSHIHPQGIVSSALYLDLPPPTDDEVQAGWLELGRSPADLRLDLPPVSTIEPRPGHLALFPSTLYHGTRPFAAERRMTVAFDVQARVAAR